MLVWFVVYVHVCGLWCVCVHAYVANGVCVCVVCVCVHTCVMCMCVFCDVCVHSCGVCVCVHMCVQVWGVCFTPEDVFRQEGRRLTDIKSTDGNLGERENQRNLRVAVI